MGMTPLGIDDYRINPARGGQPEEPASWTLEIFKTWVYRSFAGFMAVAFIFSLFPYRDGKSAVIMGLSAILFAGIAIARQRILASKKRAFLKARQEYRDGLSHAFDDWT